MFKIYNLKHRANLIEDENINLTKLKKWAKIYQHDCKLFNQGKFESSIELPNFLKISPLDYQIPIIKFVLKHVRAALFLEVGSGKTYISSIAMINRMIKSNGSGLILCPKTIKAQWKSELNKFFDLKFPVVIYPEEEIPNEQCIVVTNYERILIPESFYKLKNANLKVIIIDESTRIKNIRSQTFRRLIKLIKPIKYRYILSGTPIMNRPNDLFTQLSIINPWAFPYNYHTFMQNYFYSIKTSRYTIYKIRPWAKEDLNKKVLSNSIVMKGKEMSLEAKLIQNYIFEKPSKQQYILATDIRRLVFEDEDAQLQVIKNRLIKEMEISSGWIKLDDKIKHFGSSKIKKVIEKVKEVLKNNEKIIVWVWFRETALILAHHFPDDCVVLLGNASNRDEIINKFKNEKNLLIAQIETAKYGLNLQDTCNRMIFCELAWSPSSIKQCIARLHRYGQKKPVYVDYYITKNLIDEFMLKTVKEKKKINMRILSKFINKIRTIESTK